MREDTKQALSDFDGRVFLVNTGTDYPDAPYYHPTERYPEYPFLDQTPTGSKRNEIYRAIRECFLEMGLDNVNVGTSVWNPLGDFVRPGDTVVLKPNWVSHFVHGKSQDPKNILEVLVTNTSIIRAVVDYAYLAVGSTGRIVIADSPLQGTDFDLLLERAGVKTLLQFYALHSVPVEALDLRKLHTRMDQDGGIVEQINMAGDPQGYTVVKLDQSSELIDLDTESNDRYRVYDYDARQMKKAHGIGLHRYLISNTVLNADLIINLPKLKSHIKTGMTSAMKNFVGANGDKSFLPHYRAGSPAESGDDYAQRNFWRLIKTEYRYTVAHWPNWIRMILRSIGNRLIQLSEKDTTNSKIRDPYFSSGGSWYGNDTAWRMVVDLNTALMYSNQDGEIQNKIQRRWLTIVDAVTVGEGPGPLAPFPRKMGYLLCGVNPVELDYVCSKLMGFNWKKLRYILAGYRRLFSKSDFSSLQILLNGIAIDDLSENLHHKIQPPPGWDGYLDSDD